MFCTDREERLARKVHACDWCLRPIVAGARYFTWRSIDDAWVTTKVHPECDGAMEEAMDYCDNTFQRGEGAEEPPALATDQRIGSSASL